MTHPLIKLASWFARIAPMPVKQLVYRVPGVAGLIRRGLNRAAPHGLSEIEVAAGGLQGTRLLLDLQTEKDYWLGTYEPELQVALRELVRPGMVAYDIGANIGYITLLFARVVGPRGQVHSFEALPANVERLRTNLALNHLENIVSLNAVAVIDAGRPVEFLVGPSHGMGKAAGSAGRHEVTYVQHIQVIGISMDEYVYSQGNPAPQIVKMDIEGGEVMALPGMRQLLVEARPVLLLELHGPESARAAWEILSAAGYRIAQMSPGYPLVAGLEALDWKSYLVGLPPQ